MSDFLQDVESEEASQPDQATRMAWHSEGMRAREVFRYLEPWESNIRSTIVARPARDNNRDGNEGKDATPAPLEPANDWTPVGCEDTALASFAQLGALRLDVQRCMISLVSKDQEIILAESTRTLSLQSDLVHAADDSLWLGTTSFPRAEGMASIAIKHWKKTRDIRGPPLEDDHYHTDGISAHWHIISDLKQRKDLHNRLFIKCAKKLRFYAAVPIRTPAGTVIGSYAVLDDKPHFGISDRQLEFMEDIADTVMGHLEAKRATMQRERGDRLVKSLALFNGGKTSLREWWLANHSRQQRGEGQRRRRRSTSEEQIREDRADEEFGQTYRAQDLDSRGRLIKHTTESHDFNPGTSIGEASQGQAPYDDAQSVIETTHNTHTHSMVIGEDNAATMANPDTHVEALDGDAHVTLKKPEGFDLGHEIEGVFSRSSNLLREALNAEGVLFVDTDFPRSKRQRRGRYKKGKPEGGASDNESSTTSATVTETEPDSGKENNETTPSLSAVSDSLKHSPCTLLGFSTKIKSSIRGFRPSQKHSSLPKSLMNRLLRRYPHGKVFNFHDGRTLSSSSGGEGSTYSRDSLISESVPKAKAKSKEAQDASALAELVSEPRSVAFLPLWDVSWVHFDCSFTMLS